MSTNTSRRGLLLVGHGSTKSSAPGAVVAEAAARIRDGLGKAKFDVVACAFWKQEPFIRDAVARLDARDVVIVPMFMADGYFVREVVPRELGMPNARPGEVHTVGDVHLVLTPAVGTDPRMAGVLERRALEALDDVAPDEAALVVVGHGTTRNPASSRVVHDRVDALERTGRFGVVCAAFLDEEPRVARLWDDHPELPADVVVVPYFVADGDHTRREIPEALGLDVDRLEHQEVGGRRVRYTSAVGADPRLAEIAASSAIETLAKR